MEEQAKKLLGQIQAMCDRYYQRKEDCILQEARKMAEDIRNFCSSFLQGNIYGMEEAEYRNLQAYVVSVLEDYMGALQQEDSVWMLDTLDAGLRELLLIYMDEDSEDTINE